MSAEKQRLHKVLAWAGIASRREAEKMIAAGKVRVNGQVVQQQVVLVDPEKDRIEVVSGNNVLLVTPQKPPKKVYYLLNKPAGYLSTIKDTHNRRTVVELLKDVKERIFPVGRLDKDTTGLLLLTNDGQLTYMLTHPKFGILKTYEVLVEGEPDKEDINRLENGIKLDGKLTAPAKVTAVHYAGKGLYLVTIKLHEGRKRQVKRMFKAIGHPVLKLKRTGYAHLTLGKLKEGQYRALTQEEVDQLKKLAHLSKNVTSCEKLA